MADVGVIGVPSPREGEVPRAYIVKKELSTLSEEVCCKEIVFSSNVTILSFGS